MSMHADPPRARACQNLYYRKPSATEDRPTRWFVGSFDMMIRCSRDSIECVGLEKESIIVEHWIPFPFRALTHACAAATATAV